jgi:hypothetical protein
MLGAARASEYAGWWSQGNISATANLTSVSSLDYARKITPTYSYLMQIDSAGGGVGYDTQVFGTNDQYIDLTGLTGFTGYNNLNMTMFQHFYLPWSGKTTAFTNGQLRVNITQSGAVKPNQIDVSQNTADNKLTINANYDGLNININTADSYTAYNDRWLTLVLSTSNTASNFTNWNGPASADPVYARLALFDTQTGTLIVKKDARLISPSWDLSTLPNPLTFNADNANNIQIYGYPGGTFSDDYDYRIQNMWVSFGTMFDPLTTTDTTWLTSNPNKQIGNAVAWFNSQFNDYTYRYNYDTTGQQGVTKIANTDLYVNNMVNANLINARFNSANANVFLTQYSNTVVLMNGGT